MYISKSTQRPKILEYINREYGFVYFEDGAMRTAMLLRDYEDVVNPDAIYSLLGKLNSIP